LMAVGGAVSVLTGVIGLVIGYWSHK